ncbi:MAG: hypothetical protein WC695_09195 [Candidatus Omnitrophota bacterium]
MDKRVFLLAVVCLFAVSVFPGCTAGSSTVKSETVTTRTTAGDSAEQGNQGNFVGGESSAKAQDTGATKVEKRTEVREERSKSEPAGILGTTLHLIGQVLAFPFKLVAGVIEAIF